MLSPVPARISLVLAGLMFLLPFLSPYHFHPLTSFYTEWLALTLGLAALLPLSVTKGFWDEVEIPTLVPWLLGFAALLPLQLVWLDIAYPELSLLGALYVIWAALLVWMGRVLAKSCGMANLVVWLAAMLVLGGLLNAAAAVVQFYGMDSWFGSFAAGLGSDQRGAYGNLGQNNHFANYLTLALFSALYLQIKGRLTWCAAAVCTGIFLYALSLSGSRATWLYLAAALALGLWFRSRSNEPALRRAAVVVVVLLPLFGLLQYALAHHGLATRPLLVAGAAVAPITSIDRFVGEMARGVLPQAGGSALGTRLYMWHQALLMLARAPVLGVGFGQYGGVFFAQAAELSRYHIPGYDRNSHNALMQLLAETGLVGAGLVCAGLIGWLLALRGRISATAENWWMLCLLSVLFVHSMIEYPLWYADFLGVAALLLGMGSQRCVRLRLTALSRFAFPIMLAAGAFTLASVLEAYRDLELLLYPRVLPRNREEVVAHNEALLKLHRDTLLAPYVELAYAGTIVADRNNLADKIALNARVLRLLPVPELAYRQVLLLGLNGERDAALAQLDRAAAVFPDGLKNFLPLAEKAAQQETETLGTIAKKAREKLKPVDRNGG